MCGMVGGDDMRLVEGVDGCEGDMVEVTNWGCEQI